MTSVRWSVVVAAAACVAAATWPTQADDAGPLVASSGQLYQGVVRPSKQVELTAPVSGILLERMIDRGDRVEEGDVVARMDDGLQALVVASAKLQAESDTELRAESLARDEAKITHDLAVEAFRKGGASEWEVRRAKLQLEQAEAAVFAAGEKRELARVNFKLEEEKLVRYRLRAPFKALVDDVSAEEGATLGTTDKIVALIALDPLEAELYLPASLLGKIRVGQTYTLETDQPGMGPLQARLKFVSQNLDYASQTFRCVFEIPNPEWKLPAGFMVRLATTPE
jgi:RND family efflux transporter MFP subunit